VTQLQGGYGSSHAISIIPRGWQTQAGRSYRVDVTDVSQPISYEFDVIAC
jgi:hypothetical protein